MSLDKKAKVLRRGRKRKRAKMKVDKTVKKSVFGIKSLRRGPSWEDGVRRGEGRWAMSAVSSRRGEGADMRSRGEAWGNGKGTYRYDGDQCLLKNPDEIGTL